MTHKHRIPSRKSISRLISPRFFSVLLGLVSGFSVFYFLYFFEAYGIQQGRSYSGHSHLFRSASFGLLTFLYFTAMESGVKPKLKISRPGGIIIWYVGLVFLGSQLIFILFNFFWNWQEWSIEAYLLILREYPLMLILPFSFYFVLTKIPLPNRAVEDDYLSFQSENGKDTLKIKARHFLFANAAENYITVADTAEGNNKRHLIRKPLKILEQELAAFPEIERSHRSYLVNRSNVQAVKQTKGKVFLDIMGSEVPVSKKYQRQFLHH